MRLFYKKLVAFKSCFWRLCKARSGVVAMEFALIMPIFAATMIGSMEIMTDYYIQSTIDHAVYSNYYQIQEGNALVNGWVAADFINNALCSNASESIDCTQIQVNLLTALPAGDPTGNNPSTISVRNASQSWVVWNPQNYDGTVNTGVMNWCMGGNWQPQVLQVAYPIPLLSAIWAGTMKANNPHFVTSILFQNNFSQTNVSNTTVTTTC